MKLVLSRATTDDCDQIIDVLYSAFDGKPENGGDMCTVFCGHNISRNAPRTKMFFSQSSTNDILVKVVDEDAPLVNVSVIGEDGWTGDTKEEKMMVAFSFWQIHPTWVGPTQAKEPETGEDPLGYLNTAAQKQDAKLHLETYMENRYSHLKEPHVLCNVFATRQEYQGHGCGRMMMQWGCDVADALMLPAYLEATDSGREKVYLKVGFEDRNRVVCKGDTLSMEYTSMWRPRQADRWIRDTEDKKMYHKATLVIDQLV